MIFCRLEAMSTDRHCKKYTSNGNQAIFLHDLKVKTKIQICCQRKEFKSYLHYKSIFYHNVALDV